MVTKVLTDPWFETLDERECFTLLGAESVGRFAVASNRAAPFVIPVNYVIDGSSVVFRSGYGAEVRRGLARPTSLQVDGFDHGRRTGWTVLARGRARLVPAREVEQLVVESWLVDRRHWIRMDILTISGRRIRRP
jgi:uncharacterized protein